MSTLWCAHLIGLGNVTNYRRAIMTRLGNNGATTIRLGNSRRAGNAITRCACAILIRLGNAGGVEDPAGRVFAALRAALTKLGNAGGGLKGVARRLSGGDRAR